LLSVERKPMSPAVDELTIKLRVESLAMENLVSPFESDMLELAAPELTSLHPKTSFRHPVPSRRSPSRVNISHPARHERRIRMAE